MSEIAHWTDKRFRAKTHRLCDGLVVHLNMDRSYVGRVRSSRNSRIVTGVQNRSIQYVATRNSSNEVHVDPEIETRHDEVKNDPRDERSCTTINDEWPSENKAEKIQRTRISYCMKLEKRESSTSPYDWSVQREIVNYDDKWIVSSWRELVERIQKSYRQTSRRAETTIVSSFSIEAEVVTDIHSRRWRSHHR